jgi:hypothetical protein
MAMRNRIVLWAVLLIAAFLAGYVPQRLKISRFETGLAAAMRQNQQLQLRDFAGLAYVQAAQRNYGLAGQTCTQFFNQVQAMAVSAEGTQKQDLDGIFGFRDKVTAELARGDAGALDDLQNVYLKTRDATVP